MTRPLSEKYPTLLAWVGELDSGKIGIEQASLRFPVVAVEEHRDRMDKAEMQRRATEYGKTIRLVRYIAVEEVVTVTP